MANLAFAEAFALYGAKLRNVQWSVCALSPSGELVVSLWEQYFDKKPIDGAIHYRDSLARWSGAGNNELRQAIVEALNSERRIRAVIAYTKQAAAVDSGASGASIKKTFSVRADLLGTVQSLQDDRFVLRFVRA